jgi:Fe-S cluster assembly ATPase SufC
MGEVFGFLGPNGAGKTTMSDAAVLVGAFLVLVALSIPLFYRRDLRG